VIRVTVIIVFVMLCAGQAAGRQARLPDRIERLRTWIEAVEQHQLGQADDAMTSVASWDRTTLWRVWIDVGAIVSLVRSPGVTIFYTPHESEPFSLAIRPPSRPRQIAVAYSPREVRELQTIADQISEKHGENWLLKRGATLHADIAMLGEFDSVRSSLRRPPSGAFNIQLADGQQVGIEVSGVHWEMGRRLLDKVRTPRAPRFTPDPGSDDTVRLWYLASGVYMQSVEQLDAWHIDRAVELFPKDAETLFFAACAREMLGGPQIQSLLASTTVSRTLFPRIGSEAEELQKAEGLFRRVLELSPDRHEARIRRGRVLGRSGQHEEAIAELRRAVMATDNRLLQYYANVFLGAEADALGLLEEAKNAYEHASQLYPMAQSPRLALSTLAARQGNREEALSTIHGVLTSDDVRWEDDPWWSYYTSQARGLEGILSALRTSVEQASQ
jgi:hypothetical protein